MSSKVKTAKITVSADLGTHVINRNIYGHFAEHLGRCIYEGIFVGKNSPIPNKKGIRTDIVDALRKIKIPVLRWPGGCFADEYHWKDGIGPAENRKKMINTHWGGVVEDNSFGTHEFFKLCELLECEPYVCGNVGSGSVQEMSEWIEYMNFGGESPMANLRRENGSENPFNLKYFGVGNENWGCGGNMRAEKYADLYRQYATYCRNYGDNTLYRIACGPNDDNYHWTKVMMREAGHMMEGLALHYYTRLNGSTILSKNPDGNQIRIRGEKPFASSAIEFDAQEWFDIMACAWHTDELVRKHSTIMDEYDPHKKVALIIDEWGTWFDVEPGTNPGFLYQQNTMRDAVSAAISLNIFNNHADRVRMANIAQTINVLQAVILTEGEKMILTPTYHIFDQFSPHQDAALLPISLEAQEYSRGGISIPGLSVSASKTKARDVFLTIANPDPDNAVELSMDIRPCVAKSIEGSIITSSKMQDHNTFEEPDKVRLSNFNAAKITESGIKAQIPAMSVIALKIVA
ncbi:MAG: alpha-N-arabinofuranosidase [Oscillospiraceae bacterium]|nr:alpha-N-arabinofuranosidase [Oscillospiraceae bacterium]